MRRFWRCLYHDTLDIMPLGARILLIVILTVNIAFRMQAERRRTDESGSPVRFRPWNLRLHPEAAYPTAEGKRFRRAAVITSLLFMSVAVLAMLFSLDIRG